MPRKKFTPKQDTPKQEVEQGIFWLPSEAPWGGFVNVKLTDIQRKDFYAWYAEPPATLLTYLDDIIGEGMKVSFAYDRENQCYIVTYTGALMERRDSRFACSSRAATFEEALALSVWKHVVLALGDYGNWKPRTGEMFSWG